jgi:hypothetical protein
MLTEDTARSIGMSSYFPHVRRVFVDILRALDAHYGRPLMMTSTQNVNKVSMPLYKVFITVEAAFSVALFKYFCHVVSYFGDPKSVISVLNFLNLRHSSV